MQIDFQKVLLTNFLLKNKVLYQRLQYLLKFEKLYVITHIKTFNSYQCQHIIKKTYYRLLHNSIIIK